MMALSMKTVLVMCREIGRMASSMNLRKRTRARGINDSEIQSQVLNLPQVREQGVHLVPGGLEGDVGHLDHLGPPVVHLGPLEDKTA